MTAEWIVATAIVCIAGFVQATTGIGFAMISVPLLVLIDLAYAPGPALFAMLFLAIAMSIGEWAKVDRGGFPYLLPGLVVGTVLGSLLVGVLDDRTFGIVFGGIVLAGIGFGLVGYAPKPSPAVTAVGGTVSGAMGTVSGIHGPPLAVLYQDAEPPTARATIAFVFVIASTLSLVSLAIAGLFGATELKMGLSLVPGIAVGFGMAATGRRLIPEAVARAGMLVIAAVSAIVLIVRSVM